MRGAGESPFACVSDLTDTSYDCFLDIPRFVGVRLVANMPLQAPCVVEVEEASCAEPTRFVLRSWIENSRSTWAARVMLEASAGPDHGGERSMSMSESKGRLSNSDPVTGAIPMR